LGAHASVVVAAPTFAERNHIEFIPLHCGFKVSPRPRICGCAAARKIICVGVAKDRNFKIFHGNCNSNIYYSVFYNFKCEVEILFKK